jgi:hypothetical protein
VAWWSRAPTDGGKDFEISERIVENHVVHDKSGTGSAIGALAVIVAILAIVAMLSYSGAFRSLLGPRSTKIDTNVVKPGAALVLPR